MNIGTYLAELFRRDTGRLLQELNAFPNEDALWRTLPGVSNSAGNLFLHLEGNLREYIGRQLGNIPYDRTRDTEFSATSVPTDELGRRLLAVQDLTWKTISGLSPSQLDAVYPEDLFGKQLSVQQFLIHLQGHLNYHLGQVDYVRRVTTGHGAIPLAT